MTEKINKNFRTNIVYVFWKKLDGLLRIGVETIKNIARKLLTHTHIGRADIETPNQKEKLNGRVIRATVVSRRYAKYRSESINQMVRTRG